MKRLFTFITLLTIVSGCKKEGNDGMPSARPTDNRPTLPPNAKGGLVVASARKIILHKGDQASLTADVYDASGNKVTPNLQWTPASSTIASASQGAILAHQLGETVITVGDGVNAQDFIILSVVADSVAIPSGPANIKFTTPALSIRTGAKASIPSYILTDYKGNTVAGNPTFEFVNFDKANVSGNTINASNNGGTGYLMAKVGSTYLNGSLAVTIYSSTATDTIRSFQIIGRYPSVFNFYEEAAGAVTLQVTEAWSNSSGFHLHWYQANPDKVTVDFPEVIAVNNNGEFTSKGPGTTGIALSFKGVSTKMYSGVNVDMSGSWGGSNNGTSYSFCIDKTLTPVIYDAFNLMKPTDQLSGIRMIFNRTAINPDVSGSANIKNLTTPTTNNRCRILFGPGCSCNLSDLGPFTQANTDFGQIWLFSGSRYTGVAYSMRWINDLNAVQLSNGVRLTRGSGNCIITPGSTLTLSQVLSGHTWIPNACMADEIDPSSFQFNADGTWTAPGLFFTGEYPISWSCPDNKTVALVGMFYKNIGDSTYNLGKDTIYIYVSDYTETVLNCNDPRYGWENDCSHMMNIK